ncbi:serine/arginine-rich splicing factor SR45-like [Leopardus geoffroyi]|uniref:serine/arginine-rich splicing factor SR45-like n=1 Tax=Leopardus geoffroyi TaxID=46844 RepID=UPI001E26035A|nr:serine/arginine-rich splicing factor SR45-like [Leopardus geoffroyi]
MARQPPGSAATSKGQPVPETLARHPGSLGPRAVQAEPRHKPGQRGRRLAPHGSAPALADPLWRVTRGLHAGPGGPRRSPHRPRPGSPHRPRRGPHGTRTDPNTDPRSIPHRSHSHPVSTRTDPRSHPVSSRTDLDTDPHSRPTQTPQSVRQHPAQTLRRPHTDPTTPGARTPQCPEDFREPPTRGPAQTPSQCRARGPAQTPRTPHSAGGHTADHRGHRGTVARDSSEGRLSGTRDKLLTFVGMSWLSPQDGKDATNSSRRGCRLPLQQWRRSASLPVILLKFQAHP